MPESVHGDPLQNTYRKNPQKTETPPEPGDTLAQLYPIRKD